MVAWGIFTALMILMFNFTFTGVSRNSSQRGFAKALAINRSPASITPKEIAIPEEDIWELVSRHYMAECEEHKFQGCNAGGESAH